MGVAFYPYILEVRALEEKQERPFVVLFLLSDFLHRSLTYFFFAQHGFTTFQTLFSPPDLTEFLSSSLPSFPIF